jgi:hypothetical protein
MIKGVLIGLFVGAALALTIVYLAVIPNVKAQQVQAGEAAREAGELQRQLATLQTQVQTLTTQRDAYASKFQRVTLLYDVGMLGGETRAWAIPADVEPKAVGIKRGTFSHYDPKTQMETVHLQPTAN